MPSLQIQASSASLLAVEQRSLRRTRAIAQAYWDNTGAAEQNYIVDFIAGSMQEAIGFGCTRDEAIAVFLGLPGDKVAEVVSKGFVGFAESAAQEDWFKNNRIIVANAMAAEGADPDELHAGLAPRM